MRNETVQLCKGLSQAGLSVYKKEKYANNMIKQFNIDQIIHSNRDCNLNSKSKDMIQQFKKYKQEQTKKVEESPQPFGLPDRQ